MWQFLTFPIMNDYQIKNEIGKGSFAVVYRAVHLKTNLEVAIKTVNRKKLNKKLLENLESEISILNKARHRNVVSLYQVFVKEI
jgi:serine/threonine-protein kinase ULK/ATG1